MVIKLFAQHEIRILHWYASHSNKLFNIRAAQNVLPQQKVFLQSQRTLSDIKTNEELLFSNDVRVPSVYKIKRTIKNGMNFDILDGPACIQTSCPVCPSQTESLDAQQQQQQQQQSNEINKADGRKPNKNCIFINKTTGDVVCSKCQHIFSFSVIEDFFTPIKSAKAKSDQERARDLFMSFKPKTTDLTTSKIDKNAVPINEVEPKDYEKICEYLGIEHFPISIFDGIQMLCNVKQNTFYFPMHDAEGQIIGYKKLSRSSDAKLVETTYPESNSFGAVILLPIGKRGVREAKTSILVLNMLDALALRVEKPNACIICLPHGFKSLPQECLPVLEPYTKLVLWFDYNSVGWDMAKNFAKKLDEKRCHFVRPTENSPTPYIALQKSISIKSILTSAQPIIHKAITTFRSLRQDVLSDLQNIDKVQGIKWQRYPALNKYLKGHRRGELTVLTGPTGCGKTTFMAEYSLDLALQGVNTLWGSFEIRNTRLARTLLQQLSRKPLDENIDEFDEWANRFELLPMYFMTFHGQQVLKIVMEAIEHSQYVHDIHHVIIDNLQFMMGTSDESRNFDKYWKQDEIIAAFRTFATRRNCHVTLVIHPRKERSDEDLTTNSIFGSAKATQEADNVLIIQDKRLVSIKGKKYLQIAKNRYSGDLGIMMLEFDRDALSYAPKK